MDTSGGTTESAIFDDLPGRTGPGGLDGMVQPLTLPTAQALRMFDRLPAVNTEGRIEGYATHLPAE